MNKQTSGFAKRIVATIGVFLAGVFLVLVAGGCSRDREELFKEVKAGDYQSLKVLLQTHPNVNSRDDRGATLLHRAVVNGDTNIVALLIKEGASLEARDRYRATPILQAAKCGKLHCAQMLFEAGASLDVVDEMGWGLVHWGSASAGNRDLAEVENWLRFAVEHDLDVNQPDLQGRTALDWAYIHGHEDIEALLRRMGGITGQEVRKTSGAAAP